MTEPQHMEALRLANEIRVERADIKRRIRAGKTTVAEALENPVILRKPAPGTRKEHGVTIGELLLAQHRWGAVRTESFLRRFQLHTRRRVCELSQRQRDLIADALR